MLILQLMLGLAVAAQAAPDSAASDAATEARTVAEQCKARQFEAIVTLEVEGKLRRSRIRMCGEEGQTDAEWIRTLRDGAGKIAADGKMPQSAKDQALAAIAVEIETLMANASQPTIVEPAKEFVLQPLPVPGGAAEPSLAATYSALPPLAPKAPPATQPLAAAAAKPTVAQVQLWKPRLSLECLTTADLGIGVGGPCRTIERDTLLIVGAEEALAAGTRLRLRRDGDVLAELALPAMRRGKAHRVKLPPAACNGGFGRVDVEVARGSTGAGAPQAVGTLGNYQLRC